MVVSLPMWRFDSPRATARRISPDYRLDYAI